MTKLTIGILLSVLSSMASALGWIDQYLENQRIKPAVWEPLFLEQTIEKPGLLLLPTAKSCVVLIWTLRPAPAEPLEIHTQAFVGPVAIKLWWNKNRIVQFPSAYEGSRQLRIKVGRADQVFFASNLSASALKDLPELIESPMNNQGVSKSWTDEKGNIISKMDLPRAYSTAPEECMVH